MTTPAEFTYEMALRVSSRPEDAAEVRERERRVAFARLVREHASMLHGVARGLVPHPADAEDAVQEAFLRAWRGLGRFRREAEPRTWLCRILLNACHDQWRRSLRRGRERRSERAQPSDLAGRAARRELVDRVLDALDALPLRQRECLLLRVRAGLGPEEIASLLDIGVGSVKTHLVRGRRALVDRFGKELEG
ncbi:MAG: RNA polymerase sigma factor [Planctomycetota bacterium]